MSGAMYTAGATLAKVAHSYTLKLVAGLLAIIATGAVLDPDDTAHVEQQQTRACLALAGFSEARSDGDVAMATVMRVVLNRAHDRAGRWPRSVCAVVTQPAQFLGVERMRPNIAELPAWRRALELADESIAGTAPVPRACEKATNFHRAPMVAGLAPVCQVGVHTFFTEGTWHRSTTAMNESNNATPQVVCLHRSSTGPSFTCLDRPEGLLGMVKRDGDAVYTLAGHFREKPGAPIPFAVGQEVKTRGGHTAKIVAVGIKSHSSVFTTYAVVTHRDGHETVDSFTPDGAYYNASCPNEFDLIANRTPGPVEFVRA